MLKQTHKLVLFLLMLIIGCAQRDTSYLENVKFKVVEEDTGQPLQNRQLDIYHFVRFNLEFVRSRLEHEHYTSKDVDYYIASVSTDGNGIFSLDLSSIDAMDIIIQPGKPYNTLRFERSSDIGHTKSADRIRVVRFETGTTRVTSNMIYDLKQGIVKIIPISGQAVEEKPYKEILLVVGMQDSTKWGPKLSKDELAAITELSTPELVDMLRTGDTLHKFAALEQLKANGGWKRNFDLLMSIAAERPGPGNMIVEGLVSATDESASAEDKRLVDKFLDFLEAELKKDKPLVTPDRAIRSIAQAVHRRRPVPTPNRPKLEIIKHTKPPYGHGRAISILISCLDSKHWRVRANAIHALGAVGAEDLALANKIIAILEAQLTKEETTEENKANKERMKKIIENSLRQLKRQLRRPGEGSYESMFES
jgi:hypothetical protein